MLAIPTLIFYTELLGANETNKISESKSKAPNSMYASFHNRLNMNQFISLALDLLPHLLCEM